MQSTEAQLPRIKRFRRTTAYAIAKSFLLFFNIIPRRLAIGIASWFGLITWWLMAKEQYRMERHLRLAFKDRYSRRERELIGRSFCVNSARNYVDVFRFARHCRNEVVPLVEIDGLEHFDRAYKRGKGVFGVTGHIGNFELLAVFLALQGYRIGVIGRKLYEPRLNELLVSNRRACGLENFATTDPSSRLVDWLRSGGAIGVLIDTDSHRVRSELLPFFNRPANTPIGQSVLARRSGAALVPMACVRTEGNRYRVLIRPEIILPDNVEPRQRIIESTRLCNKELESIISEYPDQWIWLHNRWHTRC